MPQMKPTKWTLILFLTSFSILIIMSSLYFINSLTTPSSIPSKTSSTSSSSSWIWKW